MVIKLLLTICLETQFKELIIPTDGPFCKY